MHTNYSMKAPEREESEMKIKKDITQSKGCKYQARKANSEIVEFQRKNMSKSQRKSSMKYLKRGVCCCLLTNKKWLLKFDFERDDKTRLHPAVVTMLTVLR